jgi:hypothetical protein
MVPAEKRRVIILVFWIGSGFPCLADAGGAIKAQNSMKDRQQQAAQMRQQILLQQKMKEEALRQQQPPVQQPYPSGFREMVEDVVDLKDIVASLDRSGQAWTLMIDVEAKAMVVQYYIQRFRQQGVMIVKDPAYYVVLIDGMAQANPQTMEQPFANIFQVVAVIEYDFDNGQDKDALALRVLGSAQAVRANKERLGFLP